MRLMIIEDEEALAKNLKRLLEIKGFVVDWLDDPEKAFTRILMYRNDYDLILLDLMLPKMTGMQLTERLRSQGVTVPIIIITGRTETSSKIALLNSGADDYVVKPFSTDELVARINSVLRRPVQAKPVTYRLGNLEVQTSTRSVRASGKNIQLTLKEYSLFECFLRRPNEVLTREDLGNQLWDFNTVTWSNVLDVHMKNLRKKITEKLSGARFETVRGVGYRFVV